MVKYKVINGEVRVLDKVYKIGEIFEVKDLTYCDKPHYVLKITDEELKDVGVLEETIEKPIKKKRTYKKKK